MSAALTEEAARAAEARQRSQDSRLQAILDDLRRRGVREGSIAAIKDSFRRARMIGGDAAVDAVLGGASGPAAGAYVGGEQYDPTLEAYMPDSDNDRMALLERQLASETPPTLEVHAPAYDGRPEVVRFASRESAAYFRGDFAVQSQLRTAKIRERRLSCAIAAATKLRETSGRRAELTVETTLSVDEQLCLLEFGGLEITPRRDVDSDGNRIVREALMLRHGWSTQARRALSQRLHDLEPEKLRESFDAPDPRRLREWLGDDWFTPGITVPVVGTAGFDGAYPIERYMQYGSTTLQMRLADIWDEQAKARFAYWRDPMCKQGVNVATNFVMGRGFSVTATDQQNVQPVIDDYDRRHPASVKKRWLRATVVMGEIFLWRQRLGGGRVRHVSLPPETIWYVVTLAEDVTTPLYYVQRYMTHFQPMAEPDNAAHYVDRIFAASDIRHFKINADLDEIRGRSDTYAALPWHLKFRNHWEAQIEKDYASAAYAYRAIVEGNAEAVRRFAANVVPKHRPRPGSWLVVNDKTKELDIIKADTTQPSGQGSTANGILNVLAANYGFAKEYFGVDGNRTRGGAVVSAGPAEKSFEARQDDYGEFMRSLYDDAIAEAVAFDVIPTAAPDAEPIDMTFSVDFPDIIKADSLPKVQMVVVGRAQGFVSHRTGAQLWASALDIGTTYDYDDEQALIAEEAQRGIALPQMPPSFDTIDPKVGQTTDPASDDPRGALGANQVRGDDLHAGLEGLTTEALANELAARGAMLVYP